MAASCPSCQLELKPIAGDTWAMWVLGDRLFVLIPIALFFLGLRPDTWPSQLGLFLAILVPLVITMPHRLGVCLGLDYLWSVRHSNSADSNSSTHSAPRR